MTSEMCYVLLDTVKQKLSVYLLVFKKVLKTHSLTINLMWDIYFFTVLMFNILGTQSNLKSTQTILNLVLSIMWETEELSYTHIIWQLSMA